VWLAHDNRAGLHARHGDLDRALAGYADAIAVAPNRPEPLDHRGSTYRAAGRYDEALRDFDRALAIDPNCGPAW
jgi:tetratricopeptide (TPR) repeat protein